MVSENLKADVVAICRAKSDLSGASQSWRHHKRWTMPGSAESPLRKTTEKQIRGQQNGFARRYPKRTKSPEGAKSRGSLGSRGVGHPSGVCWTLTFSGVQTVTDWLLQSGHSTTPLYHRCSLRKLEWEMYSMVLSNIISICEADVNNRLQHS